MIFLIGAFISVTDESENPFLLTPLHSKTLAWLHYDLDIKWQRIPDGKASYMQFWSYFCFLCSASFTVCDTIIRRFFGINIRIAKPKNFVAPEELEIKWYILLSTYYVYFVFFLTGILKECYWMCLRCIGVLPPPKSNMLHSDRFHFLYLEHAYKPVEDCWNRPIASAADSTIDVVIRKRDAPYGILGPLQMTDEIRKCVNLGSYNYLGFGGYDDKCTPEVRDAIDEFGIATGASRASGGTLPLHEKLEATVASFLHKEAAMTIGMGYATNSTILPALLGTRAENMLVISDQLNHRSIVEGVRLTGARVKAFKHNDMDDLESLLLTSQSYQVVLIVIEGIYSMEGEFARLREIVALKKRYGAMLYLDEAHSIGAVGPTGRGVCDLFNVPSSDVDIMMGTFTKSFGSVGGYVASTAAVIRRLRSNAGFVFASAMSPPAVRQALSALEIIQGLDGTTKGLDKLKSVKDNANYMRTRLVAMGLKVIGDVDSPVIPVLLFDAKRIVGFSRECLDQNIAVVVVGYPATPVLTGRARICVSASHTREMLDETLGKLEKIVRKLGIDYEPRNAVPSPEAVAYQKLLREAPMNLGRSDIAIKSLAYIEGLPVIEYPQPTTQSIKLDLRKWDVLGLSSNPPDNVKTTMHQAVEQYGCATCGPRGFYGGSKWHLDVETELAKFIDVESAIVYSNHVSTMSSVIPAFVTSKDIIFCDQYVSYGTLAGLRLCKAFVVFYDHLDMDDLMIRLHENSIEQGQRYIITEGIFMKTGNICPLPDLLNLKAQYGAKLLVDETISFGVLGEGRGVAAHFGKNPRDIDFLVGSLEHAIGSVGGFCAGREEIVWRQRLAGAGYCFSAAAPTYAMAAGTLIFRQFPFERASSLAQKASAIRKQLGLRKSASPLIHLDGDKDLYDRLAEQGLNTQLSFSNPLGQTIWARSGHLEEPVKSIHFFVRYDTDVHFVVNAVQCARKSLE